MCDAWLSEVKEQLLDKCFTRRASLYIKQAIMKKLGKKLCLCYRIVPEICIWGRGGNNDNDKG
jgi:hypothetical protein